MVLLHLYGPEPHSVSEANSVLPGGKTDFCFCTFTEPYSVSELKSVLPGD